MSFRGVDNCLRNNLYFLIRVVVIHFYPKSCNFTSVLSLFSEKLCKLAKQDIKWRIYEDGRSMVFKKVVADNSRRRCVYHVLDGYS